MPHTHPLHVVAAGVDVVGRRLGDMVGAAADDGRVRLRVPHQQDADVVAARRVGRVGEPVGAGEHARRVRRRIAERDDLHVVARRGRVGDAVGPRVDHDRARARARVADRDQLAVVAGGRRVRDPIRAAADLVLEGRPLPHRCRLQIVAARLRLADAVRARVDLDGALQSGAGRDRLAVGVGGRCEEQHGEHRTLEHVHVSLLFRFVPANTSTRNAMQSSGGHGDCARERRVSGQRALRTRVTARPAQSKNCRCRALDARIRAPRAVARFLMTLTRTPLHGRSAPHLRAGRAGG